MSWEVLQGPYAPLSSLALYLMKHTFYVMST